jgi:hypothetical protein
MSFRRDGEAVHGWQLWLESHRDTIVAASLPADVLAAKQDFAYLLEHGYNRAGWWNESPWFEVDSLNPLERLALKQLVIEYAKSFWPQNSNATLPLSWL